MADIGESKFGEEGVPKFVVVESHEVKLRELLRNITSVEIKLCSDASKRFVKLLKSKSGGDLLHQYLKVSSKCSELIEAWKIRRGKPGMNYVMSLIAEILSHPDGKYKANDLGSITVSKALDQFSKLIIEDKLEDVYSELGSKETKRQSAALLLMASIVRRGSGLASEVARLFDFTLPIFSKLAVCKGRKFENKTKHTTREPFIGFAMSFLEVGKPGLLRWILQQKEMYSGVLRGLGNDDEGTVSYVLSTLRDRILTEESLVPPALRSVLFGNVTLEQLVNICGRENSAAGAAYSVLLMVCTEPCNGLMPDLNRHPNPLKGNPKRLLGLMKKLRATEVVYHKDLLLAIVNGRPLFASAYMDEFPYNLVDCKSATWFAAVSLAADLLSSVNSSLPAGFLDFQSHSPPSFDSPRVQCIMKCAGPRPFSRSVSNKGLLHSDFLVKHATLRLILESLNLLDSFFGSIKQSSCSSNLHGWVSLKQEIQNEVQMSLPDLQVLLKILSSLKIHLNNSELHLKRAADLNSEHNENSRKKLKSSVVNEDADILVAGICSVPDTSFPEEFEGLAGASTEETSDVEDCIKVVTDLWGLHGCSMVVTELRDVEIFFYSKFLDAVKIYHRIVPALFEGSFDFFKILRNPLELPAVLQQSLLALLIEHIGWCPKRGIPARAAPLMYKHLRPFLDLLLYSRTKDIKYQADILARAAMLSTGAFETKSWEIGSWFLFLPGYGIDNYSAEDQGVEARHNLASVVSFLCDAVSSIGNNLFKYWDRTRCYAYRLKGVKDVFPDFSPLVICVLEKCLQLLNSESRTYTQAGKSTISLYVSNTLSYLLQTQVQDELLSSLVDLFLSEKFEDNCFTNNGPQDICEWKPLQNLHLFSKNITHEQTFSIFSCGLDVVVTLGGGDGRKDILAGRPINYLSPKKINCNSGLMDFASVAFGSFLKQVPFYILFPVLMNFDSLNSFGYLRLLDLLLAKVSDLKPYHFISSLGLVLFCINQIQSSNRIEPSAELEKLSEICHVLMDNMLNKLLDAHLESACPTISGAYFSSQDILDVSKLLLSHPAVVFSLTYPIRLSEEFSDENFADNFENLISLCQQRVHRTDHHSINLLTRVFDYFLTLCNGQVVAAEIDECAMEQILKAVNALLQKRILILKDSFDVCIKNKDLALLIRSLYYFHTYIDYISPFELLKLVEWMFIRVELVDLTALGSIKDSALSVGLFIAGRALEILSNYMQQPNKKMVSHCCLWGLEETSSYVPLFEQFYFKVCEFSIHLNLDLADLCLLRVVNVLRTHIYWRHRSLFLPLNMAILRVVMSTPMELLSNCIYRTSMTKAELLFVLLEVSPLHMSIFGYLFVGILNRGLPSHKSLMEETCKNSLSDEDCLMLLPAALSALDSNFWVSCGKFYIHFRSVSFYYSRILFDGFVDWKSFVSKYIFQIDIIKFLPSSVEEVLNVVNGSLLGKATQMLRHHLSFTAECMTSKKRLKLFNSICPHPSVHDDLLEYDIGEICSYSFIQCLNSVNRVVAKISICRMLLFTEADLIQSLPNRADVNEKAVLSKKGSKKEALSRVRLINMLMHAWQLIVKKFPSVSNDSQTEKGTNVILCKFLEVHILTTVTELIPKMGSILVQFRSLPFLEQFAKTSFLHRFEDPVTLKMLRNVLTSVPECKSSHVSILQLLLAHSQFAPTIHPISRSSVCSQMGPLFRPMSSILRSLVNPYTDANVSDGKDELELSIHETKRLEVIKLLRRLCCFNSDSAIDTGVDSKELIFLLLSSYGATLSEIDLEIYNLMHDIELADKLDSGSMAEMDYLWGTSAVKLRNEQVQEPVNGMLDAEAIKEDRRRQFRENLPIDPKMCAATVLYFPYDRTTADEPIYWKNLQKDGFRNGLEPHRAEVKRTQQYDPVFILRFSIHSLSLGYLEPLEFASLGLLAVVFISISSPSGGIRRLGYEALGKFKNALEKFQKRKDLMRLRLLLTYLQNGIEEPWQQIPSIIAVFAAEASFMLLDNSHGHYSTISRLLMCSPKVNFKHVPLFHDFFWSSSIDFKMERLWILQLLYAGLNLDRDAQICIRSSIFEVLLSFYTSLADNGSKELILLIMKKSVKLHKMTQYLVEHCGLLSWFSSILSCFLGRLCTDQHSFSSRELTLVLEVVNDVIASRNIIEWLKDYALEQLSDFASHLYKLLVGDLKFIKHHVSLVNISLQILVSLLKISQERKIYQPRLSLSSEGLFQLYEAIDSYKNEGSNHIAEYALKVILMTTPSADIFHLDQRNLSKFVRWSISTAMLVNSGKMLQSCECYPHCTRSFSEEQHEDSLISKLLHWLSASVILRMFSWNFNDFHYSYSIERPGFDTLKSFLEYIKKGPGENDRSGFGCEEILAPSLLYLQQLLGLKCRELPSVVCGLCLLLLPDVSHFAGSNLIDYENDLTSLLSRIRSPPEANLAWRWSFYEASDDSSLKQNDAKWMDELHACQTLLVIFSNLLGKEYIDKQVLRYEDVENCGVFEWERNMLETQ